ncbi:hypothetical protein BH11MYX1_BH11MYX1_02790 [soil metagenome]
MLALQRTIVAAFVLVSACKKPIDPGPELQIVGETVRLRTGDPVPRSSPWFDGARVTFVAARGETLGFQVIHRGGGPVTVTLPQTDVHGFAVDRALVKRASSDMYGTGMRGGGDYPDGLTETHVPATDPAYFTITVPPTLAPGHYPGELVVAGRKLPIDLDVAAVTLVLPLAAWAEYNPKEIGGTVEAPSEPEKQCIAMFRERGVLLAPPTTAVGYRARKELLAGAPFVPVELPADPQAAASEARAWRGLLQNQRPFAIPIDEPNAAARANVHALAEAVHEANRDLLFAVTDEPRSAYGDAIDLYVTLVPKLGDAFVRWTYNGAEPRAGSMVVDASPPGTRTWGWIAWRYRIAIWYAWDALYWHDRHNHKSAPPRVLDPHVNAESFDNGDDHGNLDGVLALPDPAGCRPTLRLEALRRGLEDRALLDLAAACDVDATNALAKSLVPEALGDASRQRSWPSDEAPWEAARRRLLELADCNH